MSAYSKKIKKLFNKAALQSNPSTPYGVQVELTTRGGGLRAGYINRLNRLRKKTPGQLKGLPGCGPNSKDFMPPY